MRNVNILLKIFNALLATLDLFAAIAKREERAKMTKQDFDARVSQQI